MRATAARARCCRYAAITRHAVIAQIFICCCAEITLREVATFDDAAAMFMPIYAAADAVILIRRHFDDAAD